MKTDGASRVAGMDPTKGVGGSGDSSRSTDSVVPGSISGEAGWWTIGRFTFALAGLGTG